MVFHLDLGVRTLGAGANSPMIISIMGYIIGIMIAIMLVIDYRLYG